MTQADEEEVIEEEEEEDKEGVKEEEGEEEDKDDEEKEAHRSFSQPGPVLCAVSAVLQPQHLLRDWDWSSRAQTGHFPDRPPTLPPPHPPDPPAFSINSSNGVLSGASGCS